jgi:hypothetical protein
MTSNATEQEVVDLLSEPTRWPFGVAARYIKMRY